MEGSRPPPGATAAGFVPKRWAHNDGSYWGSPETTDLIVPGFYHPTVSEGKGFGFQRIRTQTDNLLRLPDPTCDMLLNEFMTFWTRAPEMAKRGLTVKRGLMLYGPPGSGKTSAASASEIAPSSSFRRGRPAPQSSRWAQAPSAWPRSR